ncbi:MAG: regulator, partial [Candidatus Sericytochromatia bacterium]
GNSFTKIVQENLQDKIWSILITKDKSIVIGTENGVFYSNNLSNWNEISSGLRSKKVYSLAINKEGFLFAGTYGWGVFKSQKSFSFS